MPEAKAGGEKARRDRALPGEEEFLRHLAEDEACGEGGHPQDGRTGEHAAERLGELEIRHTASSLLA